MAPVSKPRIGIIGGSFNPIHFAHLAIAQLAYEHFALQKVYFIPAYIPPHKRETITISARHRLAMLRRAVKGNRAFFVWDGELKRKGISFTVDTLNELKKLHPESQFYFIIGSDNIVEILTWRKYKAIIKMVTLCVTHRPGYSMRIPPELSEAKTVTFPSPEWRMSSSVIRSYFARNISCKYMLPDLVREYIQKNKLYNIS